MVDLEYLLSRGQGWNQQQKWEETLSGGEKQRVAIARLLYHKPKFAILDEATSAVNIEGETKLYTACSRESFRQFSSPYLHEVRREYRATYVCCGV